MKKARILIVAGVVAGLLAGCFVRTGPRCRAFRECYWDHGRRICEQRCR